MAYIGIQPAEKFTSFATQEFSTSATTSYTLDHAVANENELALFINNVRQQPGSGKAYTATGTALTLSAATASTDTMYCVFLGRALQTVVPATNSITAAMVGNDLISGKDALASEPADTDEFLVSDAGTLKRIDYSLIKGGGITQADQWRLSSPMQLTTNDITANLERVDDSGFGYVGDGMTESSGVFSFPETGIYRVDLNATFYFTSGSGESRYIMVRTQTTTNNSSYTNVARAITSIDDFQANTISSNCQSTIYLDVTDTSNVKVKFTTSSATQSGYYLDGTTADNYTTFTFTRLGDT